MVYQKMTEKFITRKPVTSVNLCKLWKKFTSICTSMQLFVLLSSLRTSTIIRHDIWYKVNMGVDDIPVSMVEIVSGRLDISSFEQTTHKQGCNTIDQLRVT